MTSIAMVRQIALSFPETTEQPHFHLVSFRVRKKIFCTIHEKDNRIMVKLSLNDQSVFCAFDKTIIYPVPGKWGKNGATFIELKKIKKAMLKDAIGTAYCAAAPAKLAAGFLPD
jgi:predicted DNA-binding protein (MmcQ/YjbR family)